MSEQESLSPSTSSSAISSTAETADGADGVATVPENDQGPSGPRSSTATDSGSGNEARTHRPKRFVASATDEEFRRACVEILAENPLSLEYPRVFEKAADAFVSWRRRFATRDPKLWKRLFDTDRVVKEFAEAAPVLHAVLQLVENEGETETDSGRALEEHQSYTIIDLCSGKGYLGMLLSEMLPPSKVFRIVLMDKAWPLRNAELKPHHINWEHIYGTYPDDDATATATATATTTREESKEEHSPIDTRTTDEALLDQREEGANKVAAATSTTTTTTTTTSSTTTTPTPLTSAKPPSVSKNPSSKSYYDTWPIPIDTSKQDLKASRQLAAIQKHYLSNPDEHPVIVLGIHLCGILSLRAIDLFNDNPSVRFLALKPCCLPGMIHAKRKELFAIGSYCFPAEDVCVHGKWSKNKWVKGPPRSHLEPRFKRWAGHLYRGIGHDEDGVGKDHRGGGNGERNEEEKDGDDRRQQQQQQQQQTRSDKVRKVHARVCVQHDGGFQNDFLFAERLPMSSEIVWKELEHHAVTETNREATD